MERIPTPEARIYYFYLKMYFVIPIQIVYKMVVCYYIDT